MKPLYLAASAAALALAFSQSVNAQTVTTINQQGQGNTVAGSNSPATNSSLSITQSGDYRAAGSNIRGDLEVVEIKQDDADHSYANINVGITDSASYNNQAKLDQTGAVGANAEVAIVGADNVFKATQSASGSLKTEMAGAGNAVDIAQAASWDGASDDYQLKIAQDGVGNQISVTQNGSDNLLSIGQGADVDGNPMSLATANSVISAWQEGPSQRGYISQWGEDNTAELAQFGGGDTASITQYGDASHAFVVQSGSDNTGVILQTGSASEAGVLQNGDNNFAAVSQFGDAMTTTVSQMGAGNYAQLY